MTNAKVINFVNGQQLVTKRKRSGVVVGWVGNPPNKVRVQWSNGEVIDYAPAKLSKRIKIIV